MFEYPAQEVIGQRVAILHPKRDWENFPTMQLALKQGKKGFSGESNLLRKSGEQFPVLFTIHPLRDSLGEVIGTLGVTFDITDRKHAEQERQTLKEQLHQKHKMEAVGYMAGGMAHNFNNNLAIILGNIELTQLKSQDPNVQELLKNAKVAIMRSKDLVNKIITYSRKGVQNKAPMLLLTIINETISLLGPTLPTTITLQKNIDPSCDSNFINADPSQIQEVLVNSINNAVQAMDEKGELIISLTPVELEEKDIPPQYEAIPGSYANLSIQDTGCGMPAEIVAKIFDPFFTTKEDYEGAGMGLSTVQGIVAQHGGLIKVSSILARGTIFNIYFPITNETAKETKPSNEDMPKGTERILFVDDDTTLANLGEQLLAKSGYQVTAMTSSQEALKLFQANPNQFDLVITDQTMPELTGAELIEKLKQINLKVPTILCTGFSSKVDEDKSRELGLSAFMIKPLVLPELLQTIRQVLDGEKE